MSPALAGAVVSAGGFVLILTIYALLSRRGRATAARRRAEAELDVWNDRLAFAARHQTALFDEHAALLGRDDLDDAFSGDSATRIRELAERIDELTLMTVAAEQLLDAVSRDLSAGSVSEQAYHEAWRRLTASSAAISSADCEERPLLLSAERKLALPTKVLLSQIDKRYVEVARDLDRLQAELEARWAEIDALVVRLARVGETYERLTDVEHDLAMFDDLYRTMTDAHAALKASAERDPLGMQAEVSNFSEQVVTLEERFKRLGNAVPSLSAIPVDLQLQTERLEKLREEGLALLEPGFEPDAMIGRVLALRFEAIEYLEDGNDHEASLLATEARTLLDDLSRLLDRSEQSRNQSAERIDASRARAKELSALVPGALDKLKALQSKHDAEALEPALSNAIGALDAIDFAEKNLKEAKTATSKRAQRYLAAAELIGRADAALTDVATLLDEIDDNERLLTDAERSARTAVSQADDALARLGALVGEGPPFCSASTSQASQTLRGRREQLGEGVDSDTPHWPVISRLAERLRSDLAQLVERAQQEETAYHASLDLLPAVEAEVERVASRLGRAGDAEALATKRHTQAQELLVFATEQRTAEQADWPAVHELLKQAQACLESSALLTTRAVGSERFARASLANGERAFRDARRGYGHGVTAELSSVRERLDDARAALLAHDYSRAAIEAECARLDARDAQRQAAVRVKRAEDAARALRDAANADAWGASSSQSFGRDWAANRTIAQTTRRSSFGSTSGRSSFGRSAGRRKFGRSPGRHKW